MKGGSFGRKIYIPLDSLLFKIITIPEKANSFVSHTRNMCSQNNCTLSLGLFAGHQSVFNKFFIPNLVHYLQSYIKGCHSCQLACNEKPPMRQLETRINPNYIPISGLSMDLKVMPRSYKGHKCILCIIDKVTNDCITVPIHQSKSEEIGDALIENVVTKY